jgi:hypothetical protein
VDLGCLQGTAHSGTSAFSDGSQPIYVDDPSVQFYSISWVSSKMRKQDSRTGDFVTGYAHDGDAFEDEAESVTFYILHREEFRRMAAANPVLAAKLRWIETFAFPHAENVALSDYHWRATTIPWDATKLPYTWIGQKALAQK